MQATKKAQTTVWASLIAPSGLILERDYSPRGESRRPGFWLDSLAPKTNEPPGGPLPEARRFDSPFRRSRTIARPISGGSDRPLADALPQASCRRGWRA